MRVLFEEAVEVLVKAMRIHRYRGRENDCRNHKSPFRGPESDFEATRELADYIRGPEKMVLRLERVFRGCETDFRDCEIYSRSHEIACRFSMRGKVQAVRMIIETFKKI
jgi:hypothetical protein